MTTNIKDSLKQRILILDGAMGTMLQQQDLSEADFGGEEYDGCNEYLSMTRPDVISRIHYDYLIAGADIIETNTFGATPIVLSEYNLEHLAEELNVQSAKLARQQVETVSTPDWPRYVAGAMGPTTKSLSVTGGATFDELVESYRIQARGLMKGGVDLLLLETSQDLLNVKAGSLGINQAFSELGRKIPIMISGTIEPMGTTLAGQTIEAFYLSVEHLKPISVGLNCATGPEFMRDHLRTLSSLAQTAVSCYPNAGLPDEEGHYHETPSSLASKLADFADQEWLNIVGGCCGTRPEHIQALREILKDKPPRSFATPHDHAISGLNAVFLEDDNRPIFVGERTNVIGSRKFKRLISEGEIEAASEIARDQVKSGAQVIDICLADPDREEAEDMNQFIPQVVRKVKVPLMIDSTDATVVELGLKHSQGKAIINSTNLEDGEERLARFAKLAVQYGAALIVGTIDEQGMAVTRERKLEVAKRSVQLLTEKYGMDIRDIIIDPLTFPVGTGDQKYIGSAQETVEGIRLLREHLPDCPLILGVSNVSFGLPPAGREVLNSVFLYECTRAGLGYAIVNTEKLERYASISDEEKQLSRRLLFETTDELVAEFTAFYRKKKPQKTVETSTLPLEERLAKYVVDGTKQGLLQDLDEALKTTLPLDIINGPLMNGMSEVGRLFNLNELIVAEVLQSAEVMKTAVSYLEPFMEKSDSANKGKILLATVKGDVHDIGKNLVEIILSNNGFDVVNLGIKVPPEQLIKAYKELKPDMIGLSGLLVKSAQQMVVTAEDFQKAGVKAPLLVGGAALTKKFTYTKIKPNYEPPVIFAKDAMQGLDFANRLITPSEQKKLLDELEETRLEMVGLKTLTNVKKNEDDNEPKLSPIKRDTPIFTPPDFERHVLRDYPINYLRPYINLQMLIGRHLGLKGNVTKLIEAGDPKALDLLQLVNELLDMCESDHIIRPQAVYRFFPAQAVGDEVRIYDPDNHESVLERFTFLRQEQKPYLCLADYLRPKESGEMDYVAFFSVTAGRGIRELAEDWKNKGDYLRSHAIQALALELAEGFAERIHQMIRDQWGFPDPLEMTMRERFIARYQGVRVSFGYPACPNLEDQKQLFRLINPGDIGVELTDEYMMDPEASISAMVFAHPEGKYFNVK
ncbi:5-methyltetrahydrofolate--homocysteine methyltransferase [Pullulanibacillus pueri]|uniref:Methionine synthase n=1 Tax=Pullulanibacillus pueri TaxID=1437324 RepID=A0A8J2ZVX9_9BACL|nr:methionine synthase [Pullulanibacillus pueri]MBM7682600.1 5-methyltetrahydrofolate--homocysteine methyltransferase [Pullulanibacillus pueri]GGH82461.1 methionine synthase [Pullulanibacillus pueri]